MDKEYLVKFLEEKIKVKLNLTNGKFFTGFIIELGESSLLFLDKYNAKIPFAYEVISYVDPIIIRGSKK